MWASRDFECILPECCGYGNWWAVRSSRTFECLINKNKFVKTDFHKQFPKLVSPNTKSLKKKIKTSVDSHKNSIYKIWKIYFKLFIFTSKSISHGVSPARPVKRFFKSLSRRIRNRIVVWEAFSSNHLACRIVAKAPTKTTKCVELYKIFCF